MINLLNTLKLKKSLHTIAEKSTQYPQTRITFDNLKTLYSEHFTSNLKPTDVTNNLVKAHLTSLGYVLLDYNFELDLTMPIPDSFSLIHLYYYIFHLDPTNDAIIASAAQGDITDFASFQQSCLIRYDSLINRVNIIIQLSGHPLLQEVSVKKQVKNLLDLIYLPDIKNSSY